VALAELFASVLITGVSLINAAPPAAAFGRSRDLRFILLSLGHLLLAFVGAVWAWGEIAPLDPPGWSSASLPIMVVVLLVALLFLSTTLWPRRG
jgi:hypothetical protein